MEKIHCWSWREPWTNDGERSRHGLPNSRTTTFRCEIRAKYQRSTIDSENWEPPRSTCSSTWSTTESIIWSFQSIIKTNDSGCWEHRIMWITRDGTQNAVHSMYIIVEIGIFYCTCGHFLHKERGANQQFINETMDLLSVPGYVIKKGRPHGHRYGKKPGDKEYHTANQLKKRCKKKYFQGIHVRFIRDPEFRNRIIENHRDEELCRRWDALADEDHTHHLTTQEYSL